MSLLSSASRTTTGGRSAGRAMLIGGLAWSAISPRVFQPISWMSGSPAPSVPRLSAVTICLLMARLAHSSTRRRRRQPLYAGRWQICGARRHNHRIEIPSFSSIRSLATAWTMSGAVRSDLRSPFQGHVSRRQRSHNMQPAVSRCVVPSRRGFAVCFAPRYLLHLLRYSQASLISSKRAITRLARRAQRLRSRLKHCGCSRAFAKTLRFSQHGLQLAAPSWSVSTIRDCAVFVQLAWSTRCINTQGSASQTGAAVYSRRWRICTHGQAHSRCNTSQRLRAALAASYPVCVCLGEARRSLRQPELLGVIEPSGCAVSPRPTIACPQLCLSAPRALIRLTVRYLRQPRCQPNSQLIATRQAA